MSAWLVSKAHVDVLVTAAIALGLLTEAQASAKGDEWWQQNVANLRALYPDDVDYLPAPGSYIYTARPVEDLEFVFVQVGCFEYQCADVDYDGSVTSGDMAALAARIMQRLGAGGATEILERRDDCIWGVTVDEQDHVLLRHDDWLAWLRRQPVES